MTSRTIGIDLAIRGEHVAQIFEDGRPLGRPLRFRHDPASLDGLVARATAGLGEGDVVQAVMEPTGMSWFPVAHWLADAGVSVARVKGRRSGRSAAISRSTQRPISPTPTSSPRSPASADRGSIPYISRHPRAMRSSGSRSSAGVCRTRLRAPSGA
jgi:hypothetical protein